MNAYLCSTRLNNWEKIKSTNSYFAGLHWQKKMTNLEIGDILIFYIKKEYTLVALYKVVEKAKVSSREITIKLVPIKPAPPVTRILI